MSAPETTARRRRLWHWLGIAAGVLLVVVFGAAGGGLLVLRNIEAHLPPVPDPAAIATSTLVVDRDDRLLRPFTIAEGRWRLPVTMAEVDPRFLDMLIAYEDQNFVEHHGVDWASSAPPCSSSSPAAISSRAARRSPCRWHGCSAASRRAASRQVRQIVIARKLEAHLTKNEILTLYLTLAPYGGNIEGVRAASLAYFGKEPTRLTVAEAALLVALPQSPEARRPDRDPAAAKAARDRVLDRLVGDGVITAEEADAAKSEPVPTARRDFPMLAAHLAREAVSPPDRAP